MTPLLLLSVALAQVWENPCKARPELREEMAAGVVNSAGGIEGPDFVYAVSSSLLPPSSSAPPVGGEDDTERYRARDTWSCTYGAPNLLDRDPSTAWVEGEQEVGVGELVVVEMKVDQPVEIWAGYGKSAYLHAANARPREVEVSILAGGEWIAADPGSPWMKNKVIATHTVELRDHNGYQPLPLPAIPPGVDVSGKTFVVVTIRSAYAGMQWQDTCISEIRNQ